MIDVTRVARFATVSAFALIGALAVPATAATAPVPSISKLSASSKKASVGDRIVFTVTLKNSKSQPSAPTPMGLYLSRTSKPSDGRAIVSAVLPAMPGKSRQTRPVEFIVPADLAPAKYRVLACRTVSGKQSCPKRTDLRISGSSAVLAVEPAAVDFGSVADGASSKPVRLIVHNVGQASSGEVDLGVDGDDDDHFKIVRTDCTKLAPGQTCSADAIFRPKDDGELNAILTAEPDTGKAGTARLTGIGRGEDENDGTDETGGASAPPPCGATPGTGPAPATVLNLTNWKLTLPTDGCDSDVWADEVTQPTLNSFRDARAFFVSGGVVFRAQANGARTSANTKYPRSELREMTNQGKDRASWSNASGKGTHTMTMDAAITRTPANKAEVVAAQIHDAADDVMMIRLYGKRLVLDAEDSKVQLPLDDNYVLGRRFNVSIAAANGNIHVVYNSTRAVDYKRSGSGMYFKAGCYSLSNTSFDAPGEYGEVVIFALAVSHS
ncbi:MAG: polysaccharide lyase family 7 protein [Aeromicrobium sp.]